MNGNDSTETRDTLLMAGGLALMVFGAGMLLANPTVRRTLIGALVPMLPTQDGDKGPLGAILPDVEHYLRLKAM